MARLPPWIWMLTCALLLAGCMESEEERTRKKWAAIREKERAQQVARYTENRAAILSEIGAAAEADPERALQLVRELHLARDADLNALEARAKGVIAAKAAAAEQERLRVYRIESAKQAAEDRKLAAASEKADQARRRREGVRIGMTEREVLQSSWGRPERVHRTTSAAGVREQWVYRGGNYLYFQDGILITVQN